MAGRRMGFPAGFGPEDHRHATMADDSVPLARVFPERRFETETWKRHAPAAAMA